MTLPKQTKQSSQGDKGEERSKVYLQAWPGRDGSGIPSSPDEETRKQARGRDLCAIDLG